MNTQTLPGNICRLIDELIVAATPRYLSDTHIHNLSVLVKEIDETNPEISERITELGLCRQKLEQEQVRRCLQDLGVSPDNISFSNNKIVIK